MSATKSYEELVQETTDLQARLTEAEETLRAIRSGEVDALVVSTTQGNQIFTLQSADQPYRLLVEQMQQGAVTVSSDGTILYCNRYFAAILGFPSDHLVSHRIDQYIVPPEREAFNALLRPTASDGSASHEFNFQNQINQITPMFVSANLLLLDPRPIFCLIIADISERKKTEQQTIELELEKQRTKVLADFVRNTSHDLKTPLSVITTGLYLIQRIQDEAQRSKKIRDIERNVWYLTKILAQLQQMAVMDSITEVSIQTGNINSLIIELVWEVSLLANEKQITILTALEEDISAVLFDFDMLHRALLELIDNAIRFTPQGGQIQIRSTMLNNHKLRIEVEDNGMGIPQDKLPRIFERFYKVDEARSITGGAGLGLPMVKRVIELHHGSIEVESIPNTKTTFRMILPTVILDTKSSNATALKNPSNDISDAL